MTLPGGLYSPILGIFIDRDPIEADPNLYRYCGNEPTDVTDPSGLASETADGVVEGWGTTHAELHDVPSGLVVEVVDNQGKVWASFTTNQTVGGMPAVAFAARQIQSLLDPKAGTLKRGLQWRFKATAGGSFRADFKRTAGEKCPYWLQFRTCTVTQGGRQLDTAPWDFDKPNLDEKWYLKIYTQGSVDPKGGTASMWDTPYRGWDAGADVGLTSAHDKAGRLVYVSILKGKAQSYPRYQQEVGYAIHMQFQTYLVNPYNYSPLGYFSWGLTVAVKAAGPDVALDALKWNAGPSDPAVWKSPR
jgi:hypothetical protein